MCKSCHEYGHFARKCSKILEKEVEKEQKKGWQQVAKKGKQPQVKKNQAVEKEPSQSHRFQALTEIEENETQPEIRGSKSKSFCPATNLGKK